MAELRPGFRQCKNPTCRATKGFVEDIKTGDLVCLNCGRVLEEKLIDQGADWRNFDDNKDKSHAVVSNNLIESMSTTIAEEKGSGSRLSVAQRSIAMESSERAIMEVSSKINEIGARLGFTEDILKRARHAYKTFYESKQRTMRGSKGEPIVCALLYLSCKEEGVPRTFKELSKESGVNEKEIRGMYTKITKILPKTTGVTTAVAPADLIIRFCSKLNLPQSVVTEAQDIARLNTPNLEGKNPNSIAAASILAASKASDPQRLAKDIAKAASITSATVMKIYSEILANQKV